MFKHQPGVAALPCGPSDLLKVLRGMNMVKLSIDDYVSEPCETYVVTSRASGAAAGGLLQTHIVFYLESPAIRAVFSSDRNPYPAARRIEAEREAMEMVEQMGAILEDAGWEGMSPAARTKWLAQEYLFRVGEKRPRPGERAAVPAAADLAGVPGADSKGGGELESHFDELLDSVFFEPSESPAPPAKPRTAAAAEVPSIPAVKPPLRVPSAGPDAGTGGESPARRTLKFLAGY